MPESVFTYADDEEREICAFLSESGDVGEGARRRGRDAHRARLSCRGAMPTSCSKRVHLRFVDFLHAAFTPRSRRARDGNKPGRTPPTCISAWCPSCAGPRAPAARAADGEIVEWAVHMRRFPQEAVLSHREERGLSPMTVASRSPTWSPAITRTVLWPRPATEQASWRPSSSSCRRRSPMAMPKSPRTSPPHSSGRSRYSPAAARPAACVAATATCTSATSC